VEFTTPKCFARQQEYASGKNDSRSFTAKDADPDIPILKQAKAEYAKLR